MSRRSRPMSKEEIKAAADRAEGRPDEASEAEAEPKEDEPRDPKPKDSSPSVAGIRSRSRRRAPRALTTSTRSCRSASTGTWRRAICGRRKLSIRYWAKELRPTSTSISQPTG